MSLENGRELGKFWPIALFAEAPEVPLRSSLAFVKLNHVDLDQL